MSGEALLVLLLALPAVVFIGAPLAIVAWRIWKGMKKHG